MASLCFAGCIILWLRSLRLKQTLELERNNHYTLTDQFTKLSQQVVLNQHQTFVDLARTSIEGTLNQALLKNQSTWDAKQTQIEQTLSPIQKSLSTVDEKLAQLEKDRIHAYSDLRRHLVDLSQAHNYLRDETSKLVQALRTPAARGKWGEIQLKRVVEMAGMLSHCDFIEQQVLPNGQRPDLVIHLPNQTRIVIDAKTPLSAYLSAIAAPDEATRHAFMVQHAQQVRAHVKHLGQKSYWSQFETSPEFVVLFLPGESFFSAALDVDPELIEIGMNDKVLIATPTTLIALLKSVAYGWRQESLAEHSRAIGALGKELYTRLFDMTEHFNKLGRHLQHASTSFSSVSNTFERKVLSSARKLADMDPSLEKTDLTVIERETDTIKVIEKS